MDQNGVKQYFERYGMRIEVKRETSIFNPRLSDSYIYYLVEGIASLTSLTMDGEEKDFIYFPHDHLLGFAPALMRHYRKIRGEEHTLSGDDCLQEKIPFGIDTKTDCVFYRLDERTFETLLEEDACFLSYIMEAVTCNYVTLVRKFHDTQEECASKRLYKWFLAFSSREGQYRAVPHGFTYAEIAKYLGMHPVTVSKLSSALKKSGIIKKEKGRILIIDEARLKALI